AVDFRGSSRQPLARSYNPWRCSHSQSAPPQRPARRRRLKPLLRPRQPRQPLARARIRLRLHVEDFPSPALQQHRDLATERLTAGRVRELLAVLKRVCFVDVARIDDRVAALNRGNANGLTDEGALNGPMRILQLRQEREDG